LPHYNFTTHGTVGRTPANRFGLDYAAEAKRLAKRRGIFDFHTHVNGLNAAQVWKRVAEMFGVERALTQVPLQSCEAVRDAVGDMVEFIAFPNFRARDRRHAMMEGFLEEIAVFSEKYGARMLKLWNAPRLREFFPHNTERELTDFDGFWRTEACRYAKRRNMAVMVHVADPDTWFMTRYADSGLFGRKRDHYKSLERLLDLFDIPFVAAHMGGWPENPDFLDGLLMRHPNLYLDTSATKWIVREISGQHPGRMREFFERWNGRIFFGSDIVTTDEHLGSLKPEGKHPMADLADSPEAAFELYASRYLALRVLLETDYQGESPIADPDLAMVDPRADGMSAPNMRGLALPESILKTLYSDAGISFLSRCQAV